MIFAFRQRKLILAFLDGRMARSNPSLKPPAPCVRSGNVAGAATRGRTRSCPPEPLVGSLPGG